MSVDEARHYVLTWPVDVPPIEVGEYPSFLAALDLLVFEVQAAMPCYYNWDIGGDPARACPNAQLDTFCVTCTARAELARRKVPA